jgi:hypothetical protein
MVKQWRCVRCNRLYSPVGVFEDAPERCEECGYEELDVLGADDEDLQRSAAQRYLTLDSFILLAMGIGVFNVLAAVLGGFVNNTYMLASAGVSFPLILSVAYLVTKRTAATWYASLGLFSLSIAYNLLVAGAGYTVTEGMGMFPTGDSTVGKFFASTGEPMFMGYAGLYALLALVAVTFLIGGRDEIAALRSE